MLFAISISPLVANLYYFMKGKMKVLWFSVTPSLFNPKTNSHNGGGWIASLEQIIHKVKEIELGVAFQFPDSEFKYEKDGVCYYPIPEYKLSRLERLCRKDNKKKLLIYCKRVIDDFHPDLIHIFGSENDFGLLCQHTRIPIVIHIQGSLPPIYNAWFPVGMNRYDFVFTKGLSWKRRLNELLIESTFHRSAEQEVQTIQHCHYFMGRTGWDKGVVSLFNPDATYFHCEEALRDSFMQGKKYWSIPTENKVRIVSVISPPFYKGVDLILKTSSLLKRFTTLDFEWRIYGTCDIRLYEYKYGIRASEVNVKAMGTASKEELVDVLCASTLYVHPSYIDNSPNSVCEAQLLGLPVIATNVGGLSSIIRDGETGILVPANAPYTLAFLIKQLSVDSERCQQLSSAARKQAAERHNPEKIRNTVLDIYKTILSNRN